MLDAQAIKQYAMEFGADVVGIASMDRFGRAQANGHTLRDARSQVAHRNGVPHHARFAARR